VNSAFAALDWAIFIAYFVVLIVTSVLLSRMKVKSTRDYFIGGNSVPMFAVVMSSYYWQQSTELPLLNFALGVMAFTYSSVSIG